MNNFRNLTAIVLLTMLLSLTPWAGLCFGTELTEEAESSVTETIDSTESVPIKEDTIEAAEIASVKTETIESKLPDVSYTSKSPLDNDALFEEYLDALFDLDDSDKTPAKRRNQLKGVNRAIYEKLKPEIEKVANGSRSSTIFEVSLEELNLEKNGWTAAELGVTSIIENGTITQEAVDALWQTLGLDINVIVNTLLADCPYELYWYDKVAGANMNGGQVEAIDNGGEVSLRLASGFSFSFSVAQGYASGQYEVDTTNIERVNHAVDKASAIVDSAKTKADREKLDSYREEICSLVEYDYSAADDSSTSYGDPWQIVSVFDEDNSTNVVCEGYAKAFQYLCKLTKFDGDISCISVTGTMLGGTGEGAHMWNIVNMEDGKNYLVDVTNCDGGSIGAPDKLFLIGNTGGDYENGYTFYISGENVSYAYDSNITRVYSREELELAQAKIPESGTCGCDAYWSIDASGKLTISGDGAVSNAPWKEFYASEIKEVVIEEGITGLEADAFSDSPVLVKVTLPEGLLRIGDFAFYNTGLTEVDLPESVERIGAYSFGDCKQLSTVALSSNLQQIDFGAFCRDTALAEISIPDGTYVDNNAFEGCSNLRSAYVGGDIGEEVFNGCTSLQNLTMGSAVRAIGKFAFANCSNLESAFLPDSVTDIGESAFSYCTALTTINIPNNLKTIPLQAFSSCTSLRNVTWGDCPKTSSLSTNT